MIEQRYDDFLKTYMLCRTGFLFLAIGLVPAAFLQLLLVVGQLGDPRISFWIDQTRCLEWIATLTTWSTLIGTTLLWGRWDNTSWQRRTSLLMTMCLIDVAIWFLDLGDKQALGESAWFRSQFGHALGWAEFALLASLSGDFLTHLGLEQAEESAKSTRSLAASGAMIWLLLFCELANLRAGWPIRPNPQVQFQTKLLFLGAELISTICLIQVTALVVAALRQSDRQIREMAIEERDDELYTLPNEPDRRIEFATAAASDRSRTM
ncbi:MAG: hypothetical protein P4L85_15050 [Paludisphaera borealis]|uniref:hypothetical protein n=1 Tax=Paludisphaera borealis TaxID=1387353 RepID=UPI00284762AD|nr:hypothetical protein [Paludisphaera borealis]MDR3620668.1 hypothetical protein [Paludisphaera borealis]